jgi:hypothetical protein
MLRTSCRSCTRGRLCFSPNGWTTTRCSIRLLPSTSTPSGQTSSTGPRSAITRSRMTGYYAPDGTPISPRERSDLFEASLRDVTTGGSRREAMLRPLGAAV